MDPKLIALLPVIVIVPMLGPILSTIYNLLGQQEVAPWIPQINNYSFGQTILFLSTILVLGRQSDPLAAAMVPSLLILLLLTIVSSAASRLVQYRLTADRVTDLLDGGEKGQIILKPGVSRSVLLQVAYSMVDPDFYPDARLTQLTRPVLRRKREQLVELIKILSLENPGLTEKDFLVAEDKRALHNFIYTSITALSLILYLVSVWLNVSIIVR